MTDQFDRKIREAHNKMSDYLDDLVQFVNDLSERVDGCADVARKALLQQEKRDWAVDRRIGRLADRVASLEEAADRTPEIGIPTDEIDDLGRCVKVCLLGFREFDCTLADGHGGDHVAELTWVEDESVTGAADPERALPRDVLDPLRRGRLLARRPPDPQAVGSVSLPCRDTSPPRTGLRGGAPGTTPTRLETPPMIPTSPSVEQIESLRAAVLAASRLPTWPATGWFERVLLGVMVLAGTDAEPPSEADLMAAMANPAYSRPVVEILTEDLTRTAEQARLN